MSATILSTAAGALLSLLFSYVPGFKDWYARLGSEAKDGGTRKRLVMLALLVLVALGSFGLGCLGLGFAGAESAQPPACEPGGMWQLVQALVSALMANQATYLISPKKKGVGE